MANKLNGGKVRLGIWISIIIFAAGGLVWTVHANVRANIKQDYKDEQQDQRIVEVEKAIIEFRGIIVEFRSIVVDVRIIKKAVLGRP